MEECPADRVWNIATKVVNRQEVELLIFCLTIDEGTGEITGKVKHNGQILSDVSGMRDPLGGNVSRMTLNFLWGQTSILMIGLAIGPRPAKFAGGFFASGISDESVRALAPPSDGDTGPQRVTRLETS